MLSNIVSSTLLALLVCAAVFASADQSVERPCGDAYSVDKDCVRAQLAARSGCTPTYGDGLEPYVGPDDLTVSNFFNATVYKTNTYLAGLSNSSVVDYYIDYTNALNVLLVNNVNFTASGPLQVYFHRVGQASLNVTTLYQQTHNNLLTTLLIPGTETIDLRKRQSYYYQTEDPVLMELGDANLQHYIDTDELVAEVIQAASNNVYAYIQDELFSLSKSITDAVVGLNVCSLPNREPLYQVPVL